MKARGGKQGKLTRASLIRAMDAAGKDISAIRAAFKRRRLGELTASEYHHALNNAGRSVGRPKKPKPACPRCVAVDECLRAWSQRSDVEHIHGQALLAELRTLFDAYDALV